jgi:nucleotide-binding universal stress UspA family protein
MVVTRAAALAQAAGAGLVILHVVQPPAVLADYDPALPVIQTMNRSALRQLAKWKALVEARGLTAATVCRRGTTPAHVIAVEAERHSCDYIVIGSHGHGAIYDLLVGSTTGGVLRKAHCPVVIVPALQRAKEEAPARQQLFQPSDPLSEADQAVPRQSRAAPASLNPRTTLLSPGRPTRPTPKYAN